MAEARLAAARDLCARLRNLGHVTVHIAAADLDQAEALAGSGGVLLPPEEGAFHFGRRLAALITRHGWSSLAYFGGASAPLMDEAALQKVFDLASGLGQRAAVVNNLHSTDWAIVLDSSGLTRDPGQFPSDNAIGWVLQQQAGYRVQALEPSVAARTDLDTPMDALLAARHPSAGPGLAAWGSGQEPAILRRIDELRDVLLRPGSRLAIIGRASSTVWRRLEDHFPIWVRAFVEERGMVASGRYQRGEVQSLVGNVVDQLGPERFVESLGNMVDGCLWDTRVWLAARGPWPPAEDRFAADLGKAEAVGDRALRDLTAAVRAAPIPILTGGQGIVGGSLLALLDSVES